MGVTVKDIFLILLGFVLANAGSWFDRRRKIKTHWHALRAEIVLCMRQAEDFIASKIMSPLYRYPTAAFEKTFPLLLAEGMVSEEELLVLSKFATAVQELNRGLDDTSDLFKSGDNERGRKAYERNLLKAQRLIEEVEGEAPLGPKAGEIVDRKIALPIWKY